MAKNEAAVARSELSPTSEQIEKLCRDLLKRVTLLLPMPAGEKEAVLDQNLGLATTADTLRYFLPALSVDFPTCPTLAKLIRIFNSYPEDSVRAISTATRWMRLGPILSTLVGQPIDSSEHAKQFVQDKIELQFVKFLSDHPELYWLLANNPNMIVQLSAFFSLATPLMVLKDEDQPNEVEHSYERGNFRFEVLKGGKRVRVTEIYSGRSKIVDPHTADHIGRMQRFSPNE